MPTSDVALVREQNVEFGVVCVQDYIVDSTTERDDYVRWWSAHLGRPVALIGAQRHRTYGRRDLVGWLQTVDPTRLPWRRSIPPAGAAL